MSHRGDPGFCDVRSQLLPPQLRNFWILRDGVPLSDGETGCDNSPRIEPKRGHQWFIDTHGHELFSNKKQAIGAGCNRPVLETPLLNVSPWQNNSSLQLVAEPFSDHLFGSETPEPANAGDRGIPSLGVKAVNVERKDFNEQYGSISSMGLSMSNTIEDPSESISFGGIRKVKVNQVRESSSGISATLGSSCSSGNSNTMSLGTTFSNGGNNLCFSPTYNDRNGNAILINPSFSKADGNFMPMGYSFGKGDGNFISMGHNYSKRDENILSMGQPFGNGDTNFITIGPSCEKGDGDVISIGSSYTKAHENYISINPTYEKENNFISMGPYTKEEDNIISVGPTFDKVDSSITSMTSARDKGEGDLNILSMGSNFNKGDDKTISFGSFHDEPVPNPSGGVISGYNVLMTDETLAQTFEIPGQKHLIQFNEEPVVDVSANDNSRNDTAPKDKDPKTSKKASPNNFPSNVKSLLSTGMLDGVPVKYVSWSREKTLKGSIKGTGYLCGCSQCDFSKVLNAYEFECHANCKTKHPNNHIYFENGKTIYAVVQELKNTSQETLFEAIQFVTGSQINQRNFRIWKASYQAATRELQRIYGKD